MGRADDIEDCRGTVLRAAAAQDHGDWDAFAACFTADAQLQRPDGSVLDGRAAIRATYAARTPERLTRHVVHPAPVSFDAAGTATVTSLVTVWSGARSDPPGPQGRPAHGALLLGEFADRLRREHDGRWRIHRREARFVLHR